MNNCQAVRSTQNAPQIHLNEYTIIETFSIGNFFLSLLLNKSENLNEQRDFATLERDLMAAVGHLVRMYYKQSSLEEKLI